MHAPRSITVLLWSFTTVLLPLHLQLVVHVFLFTDMLLITKTKPPKKGGKERYAVFKPVSIIIYLCMPRCVYKHVHTGVWLISIIMVQSRFIQYTTTVKKYLSCQMTCLASVYYYIR